MQDAQPQAPITISVYRRHNEIVQIETRHAAIDPRYFLTCRHADGTSQTETFDNSERLYDRLRSLGQKLSCEGWMLLPRERRGVNRLSVPLCSACSSSEAVEVLARTDADVYFGCATCGAMWRVPKPGVSFPR
jgi:phosphoglycolate phosphatase-like HAD superfamily hydrolase